MPCIGRWPWNRDVATGALGLKDCQGEGGRVDFPRPWPRLAGRLQAITWRHGMYRLRANFMGLAIFSGLTCNLLPPELHIRHEELISMTDQPGLKVLRPPSGRLYRIGGVTVQFKFERPTFLTNFGTTRTSMTRRS